MTQSAMPTMTAAELRTMIERWQDAGTRENQEIAAAIEGLTGIRKDFGPGRPTPVCPECGWESAEMDQSDFQVVGADSDQPHILFGCGHGWIITDIAR